MFISDLDGFVNQVKRAVDLIGGPTKTAHAVKVSNATIHSWIAKRKISNIDKAKQVAQLSGVDVLKLRPVR